MEQEKEFEKELQDFPFENLYLFAEWSMQQENEHH